MLLNNLSVSNGCKVSFDSESSTAPPSPEGAEGAPRTIFRRPDDDADEDEVREVHDYIVEGGRFFFFLSCVSLRKY